MKITVVPPNINISYEDFRPVDNSTISYGLNAIKNVGTKALETIIQEREEFIITKCGDDMNEDKEVQTYISKFMQF